jgi:hypothetical protein
LTKLLYHTGTKVHREVDDGEIPLANEIVVTYAQTQIPRHLHKVTDGVLGQMTDAEYAVVVAVQQAGPVPEWVTPFQARMALIAAGKTLAQVDAVIDSLQGQQRDVAYAAWHYGSEIRRDNPFVAVLGEMHPLGLSIEMSPIHLSSIGLKKQFEDIIHHF